MSEPIAETRLRRADLAELTRLATRRVQRQLVVLYAVLILVLSGMVAFVHQSDANCHHGNIAAMKFNAALDQTIANTAKTRGLTPPQKAEALANDRPLHLSTADCFFL